MKIFELVKEIENTLNCENADFEAKQIVLHALGVDSTGFMKIRCEEAGAEVEKRCFLMAKTRNGGVPLYYILGKCEFYGYPFFVGEGVLVPRDDTEILVDTALECIKNTKNPKILDLCSGSGAIAIAIAKRRPDSCVTAVELYDKAYDYLLKNIKLNNAENVTAILSDALSFVGEYDLVVSNPPYISRDEMKDLSKEVLNEPHTALFAENDGLIFYEKISQNFKFNKKFTLLFEIGCKMGEKVSEILKQNGYSNISIIDDYGKNNRVVKAEKI